MRLDRNKFDIALVRSNSELKDLSKRTGLSQATITKAHRGGNIQHKTAYKICKALKTDISDLILIPKLETVEVPQLQGLIQA